ncbi:MAG: c-type cytochrome, partial [Thiothrix sp.]
GAFLMNKMTIGAAVLLLAAGMVTGCGEKEEPKKAEAQAGTAAKVEQAAEKAVANTQAAVENTATAASAALTTALDATKQAAEKVGEVAGAAAEKTTEVAGAAVQQAANAVDAAAQSAPNGEKVYKGLCFSCHDAGVAGAPKLGDKAAWDPRIATGMDALYTSAINGKGAMPAKGGNPALSDAEIKATVDWMVAQAK